MRFRNLLASVMLAFVAVVAAPVALTGCAAFGVQAPSNFDERVVAGYKSVEVIADLVGALHAAGKISTEAANDSLDKAQVLNDGIDAAAALRAAGDFSNAETRLAAAISALELLQAQLRARQ